jgi:hypothetical protein
VETTVIENKTKFLFSSKSEKDEVYWPGLFILRGTKQVDGKNVPYAYFRVRADRNGGENPFAGTIDLRLNKNITVFKTHKISLSVDVFNFANLLNKDWGNNFNLGAQSLLFVTGFNQATREYNYRVNENVGVQLANGTPYQIQLGARYAF